MDSEPDNILDVRQLSFDGDFDTQVQEILARVRLTRAEVQNLQLLIDDVETALSYVFPGCEVHPFGSIVSGLGIKTSDIDCFIKLRHGYVRGKPNPVILARNALRRDPRKFAQLFAIASAKVPIVKFMHVPTCFNCDVNFSSMSGVRNSKLIAFLLNMDSRALPLAIIVKYWSKVYNFTGTNLMPNYALTMMVIFYLQVKSILPSVAELQRHNEQYIVDDWNTAFNDEIQYVADNSECLYQLLGGFFNFYKTFDYEQNVISPFLGCLIKKQLFADFKTLPAEYYLYKENVLNQNCKVIRLDSSICIQDPFEHSRNCTVAVFGKLFTKIHAHFELAAKMFNEKQKKDFLKAVFTVDQIQSKIAEITKTFENPNKVNKKKQQKQAKQRAKQHIHRWYKDNRKYNLRGPVM